MFEDILWSWAEVAEARVLNRPSAMASNDSKPYQSRIIRDCGFSVPETVLSTTPESVRQFCRKHGEVVYKSISGIRSIVGRLNSVKMGNLEDIMWCPTQFQEWVEGIDFRVHVVGRRIFASMITSSDNDYRYGSAQVDETELPADVANRCLRLCDLLNLELAGIDLRRTPEGQWCCFEVNPSPAFSGFQDATGQPIGAEIARLLAAAEISVEHPPTP